MSLDQAEFRARLTTQSTVWAAGAHDALSARFIELAGFDAVFASGFGVAASILGQPDIELYTMSENLAATRGMITAVSVPVVADIDTGFGNVISVMRTVREYEAAGAAAVVIEDQVSPKQCPMLGDPDLISVGEGAAKIRAAVRARRNPNFVIIGRTDALDETEIIARARAYVAAGAELIQPVLRGFKNAAGVRALREACGVPLSLQIAGFNQPELSTVEVESVAGIATYPIAGVLSVAQVLKENLAALAASHSLKGLPRKTMDIGEFKQSIGFYAIEELHKSLLAGNESDAGARSKPVRAGSSIR